MARNREKQANLGNMRLKEKINMEYRAIYKCRLCNKEFEDACTCNKGLVFDCMIAMVCGTKISQPLEPQKLTLHSCEDKSMGLADFQGWKAIDRGNQTKKDGN